MRSLLVVFILVVAAAVYAFTVSVTAGWVVVFVVSALLGGIGFALNSGTPLQVGPLPFVAFVVALVSLIVVVARVAT
jgi:hypothetical protein